MPPRAALSADGLAVLLARLRPGDHALLFGPRAFTQPVVEGLRARADELGLLLVLAPAGVEGSGLAAGPQGLGAAGPAELGGKDCEALCLRLAREGARALGPLLERAERAGRRGVLLAILHGGPWPPCLEAEAALPPALDPRLAVQCIYPAPPALPDEALRLLRAHTAGRIVFPAQWRNAAPREPARE